MDLARPAPQGVFYHAHVSRLLFVLAGKPVKVYRLLSQFSFPAFAKGMVYISTPPYVENRANFAQRYT